MIGLFCLFSNNFFQSGIYFTKKDQIWADLNKTNRAGGFANFEICSIKRKKKSVFIILTVQGLQLSIQRIYGLCLQHIDDLSKRMADKNIRTRKRSRLKRARLKLFSKIKHLVDEAHWKTAIHLCRRFDVILLPEFSTRDMMQKHGANGGWKRKISKKTCRNLAMWSHYKFRLRLIEERLNSTEKAF